MAQDDIYGNKLRWERWVENYVINKGILKKPNCKDKRKYYCQNKANFKYYSKLIKNMEVDDLSYIRRGRLKDVMNFLCHYLAVDLKDAGLDEKDEIIIQLRKTVSESEIKITGRIIKRIGRILFGEESLPVFFKELNIKTDRSKIKARTDKLTFEEFDNLMKYFSNDVVMQAYLSIAFETLARPQELCFTKIESVEWEESYAFVSISEHGKEGTKRLLCIDSFPYLSKMYNQHGKRNDKKSYLFLNEYGSQLNPLSINKKLKKAREMLSIDKPITCYSIKRFGVTYRVLQGDDPTTIQKIAGWTSIKQLGTYDLSDQQDVFKKELVKRGLIKDSKYSRYRPQSKPCQYCGELVGFSESACSKCKHILDKDLIKDRVRWDNEMNDFLLGLKELKQSNPEAFELIKDIGRKKGIID